MTFCDLSGSHSKGGNVGSVITPGLGYFGSMFLFPLGCFKLTMLLRNRTESCSEEPWELSRGQQQLGDSA